MELEVIHIWIKTDQISRQLNTQYARFKHSYEA